jgi:hypothetical protein
MSADLDSDDAKVVSEALAVFDKLFEDHSVTVEGYLWMEGDIIGRVVLDGSGRHVLKASE